MKKFFLFIERGRYFFFNCLFVLLCCGIIFSCAFGSGKPQAHVENYLIDYPALSLTKRDKIDASIRVSRFTIATVYNNYNMIFRRNDYAVDAFNYSRWTANPADMAADILLRDLQASGYFRAVFSRHATDEGRYILQGGIDEFFFRIDKNGNNAVLSLTITLKDTGAQEPASGIVFQKKYRQEELFPEQTPGAYCRAMSQALQKLAPQIINDVYTGIRTDKNK